MYRFTFQFTPEQIKEIILRHMIVEQMISEKERDLFEEMHKHGSKTAMTFKAGPQVPEA